MALADDIALALGPVRQIAERLSALERDAVNAALEDVRRMCDDEEAQARITADMMMELEQRLEDMESAGGPREAEAPQGARTTTTEGEHQC